MLNEKILNVKTGTDFSVNTPCCKCGTALKHWFEVDGLTYGSECIKSVLGITGDEVLKEIEKAERLEKITEKKAKDQSRIDLVNQKRAIYKPKNQWLIDVLIEYYQENEFAQSVASDLETRSLNEEEDKQWCISEKVFYILEEMYAKAISNGKRNNSKAYKNAVDEFYNKCEENYPEA